MGWTQGESRNRLYHSPNELMVFDDDGEVIVDHSSPIMHKAKLEPVLVLDLIGLQVAKHSGSREVVSQPVFTKAKQIHQLSGLLYAMKLSTIIQWSPD